MNKICIGIAAVTSLVAVPAIAADMAVKAPSAPPPVASWTGFYAGVDAGYGWNHKTGDRFCINPDGVLFGSGCSPNQYSSIVSAHGALAGGEAGYNWQSGVVVAGIETDLQWSGIKSSAAVPFPQPTVPPRMGAYTATDDLKWFGTTRGRLGFLATPDFLLYATAGVIYGRESATALTAPGPVFSYPSAASATRAGAVAGAGIEYRFLGNLSAKIEGLFYGLGTVTTSFTCPVATACSTGYTQGGTFKLNGAIVRAGLNWHFN